MVYYLSGTLMEKSPTGVVLDVNGVGYELRIPISTYEKLPSVGQNCTVYTHLYLSFSQDELRLYGFSTLSEKMLFLRLISISGIGPKIALSVISSMSVNMIIKAIMTEEDGLLSKVPGIGKKTAQRIIIELRDKISELTEALDTIDRPEAEHSIAEVKKALIALGYNAKDVVKTLHKLSDEDKQLPVEQQIKIVIRLLYQK